jgi:hypothetical protein
VVGEAPRHNLKEARSEGYKYASQLSSPTLLLKEQRTEPLTHSLSQTNPIFIHIYKFTITNKKPYLRSETPRFDRNWEIRFQITTTCSTSTTERFVSWNFFFLFPFLNFTVLHLGFVGFLDSWMIFMGFLVFFLEKGFVKFNLVT